MTKIVVVGSANMDLIVQAQHVPGPGETVLGHDFRTTLGGKGANQAVGAARLGADVTFVACIGPDNFGDQCLQGYKAEGIDTRFIVRDPSEATGVALVVVADDGENSIAVASGANMRLSTKMVEAAGDIIAEADVLLMQLEIPLDVIAAAAQIARANNVKVVLNPAPARELPAELLRLVDVITPNRIELAQLVGVPEDDVKRMSDEQLAKSILGLGPTSAVITLGAQGALAAGSWGWVRVPAFDVQVVDTTAAGDAFNAGLSVALGQGNSALDQAVRYACACGALAATKRGAQPSLPEAAAVQELISRSAK
jgi:ribokinase